MTEINEYRGISTNRGLTGEGSEGWRHGILDLLSLSQTELQGKKVLDVGCGGGNAVKEALRNGIDYYGVDLVPAIQVPKNLASVPENQRDAVANVMGVQQRLRKLAKEFLGRIFAVDAGKALPFEDNSFDIVVSSHAVPGYARNSDEAVTAVLEMARVAKKDVVFSGGWETKGNHVGGAELGSANSFIFPMKPFLDSLGEYGIEYKRKTFVEKGISGPSSIHLDVSHKDKARLVAGKQSLLSKIYSTLRQWGQTVKLI